MSKVFKNCLIPVILLNLGHILIKSNQWIKIHIIEVIFAQYGQSWDSFDGFLTRNFEQLYNRYQSARLHKKPIKS